MTRTRLRICVVAFLLLPVTAQADLTHSYGDAVLPGDLTGSLSVSGGGIVATGEWPGFTITWDISPAYHDGEWYAKYEYTLTGLSKELSHIIFEITEGPPAASIYDTDWEPWGEKKDYGPAPSNPGMLNSFFGVKFETNATIITFYSDRLPVWGNFYAVDGKDAPPTAAWNNYLGSYYIPTPDSQRVPPEWLVPAPGPALLVGIGLGLIGWLKRRVG